MPLLEINLSRFISASVGWTSPLPNRSINMLLSSTHPQTMLWTRRSTMSSRKTGLSGLSEDAPGQTGRFHSARP